MIAGADGYRIFLALTAIVVIPLSTDAGVYRYVDPNGTINFADSSVTRGYKEYRIPGDVAYSNAQIAVTNGNRAHSQNEISKLVDRYSTEHGLDPVLIRSVIRAESGFDPEALSPAGAMGLMQLMPSVAKRYGVEDPYHPGQNIRAGTAHLKGLLERYNGDRKLALAAYNAGEDVVDRYSGIPPYPETVGYVEKVLAYCAKERTVSFSKGYKRIYRYAGSDGIILMTDTPRLERERK